MIKKYIYLDWNVIQYMKHDTIINEINGTEFKILVKKLSKKYVFPWSEGHLQDLLISFKPSNLRYVEEDTVIQV